MRNSGNNSETAPKVYATNYAVATHWLNNHFILCNEIINVDESTMDNMRFPLDENEDIFQFFLTSASESDVEFLEEHFGLKFTYSDKLDLFVLCVTHYGTAWDYVYWETDIENASAKLGELK